MGLLDRVFGRQKTFYNLQELSKIISGGDWSNSSLIEQYGKSLYVYAAINKIATKNAAVDLKVFEIQNSKGDLKEYPAHPILDLLYRPNPYQTRSEFSKITDINQLLTGEAFWMKVRDGRGNVIELWNLRPDFMTIILDDQGQIRDYKLSKSNGTEVSINPKDIIHFREPNPNDLLRGFSPLIAAKSRIETETYATDFQRNFFANNARPDALILSQDELSDEQRGDLKASWNAKHRGSKNSSKVGILEGGLEYQQVSVTQKEMDYIESLKFTRDDILVAFGVPKSVITTDDVNYSNANSGLKTFYSETILPRISYRVEVINEMLVIPDFSERFYVDFEDPTPEDREMKLKEYAAGYGKWLTANEIRTELNLEPMPNGDLLAEPQGGVQVNQTITAPDPQKVFRGRSNLLKKFEIIESIAKDISSKSKEKAKESLLKSNEVREQYKAFVNKKIDKRAEKFQKQVLSESEKQAARILKTLDKDLKVKAVDDVIDFDVKKENKIFTELALPFMTEAAKEAGQEALDIVGLGETFNFTEQIEKRLKERALFFAQSVNDTTLTKLSKTLAEGLNAGEGIAELRERINAVYGEFKTSRAELIARTESTAVNNEGFLEAYKQSKVVNSHEWLSAKDLRVRPEHAKLDGQIIEVGKKFSNGLTYPQEPNCRCVLAPVV